MHIDLRVSPYSPEKVGVAAVAVMVEEVVEKVHI